MAGKGGGKGPTIVRNIPGLPNSGVGGLPSRGFAVFREDPEKALDFCENLRLALSEHPVGECHFDNIDVSQVPWSSLNFSILLDILQERGASTSRLKAYKCGLDDEVLRLVATWLDEVPAQRMPNEIHLSHNNITRDGFESLLNLIEAKRAELTERVPPIWLRIESNQVDTDVIDSLVAEGKVVFAPSVGSHERMRSEALVAMPAHAKVGGAGSQAAAAAVFYKGGKGAPGNAMTVRVSTPGKGGKGVIKGGKGADSWGGKGAKGSESPWKATFEAARPPPPAPVRVVPNAVAQRRPEIVRATLVTVPGAGRGKGGKQSERERLLDQQLEQELQVEQQQQQRGRAATVKVVVDRSRTPAPRKEPEEAPLPHPWEKQWSDEYQIPYYWNKETGDSLWEPPQA